LFAILGKALSIIILSGGYAIQGLPTLIEVKFSLKSETPKITLTLKNMDFNSFVIWLQISYKSQIRLCF
jgi:hypothetical protein